ncbi:transcriptional regulator [Massilia aurea]|uniref:Transcriptional regulator n=1 Tax=Massilia aurea TaxID=373040 RepID=A0A422QG26_9BURK|nr:MFS transporter [Massilia aurea]RNF28915.1 transcriptional regulator [Massilia aurea]
MNPTISAACDSKPAQPAAWGAVMAMSLAAFALVASEFMPVSLLTPLAAELRISEGQAGQSIAISGLFALFTSLFLGSIVGRLDRKILLLGLTFLMIVSGTVAAFAPNYFLFMVGRALIGVAIGGFWSMSAATVMRLVPARDVPRALALLNGGNALATVIAAPAGSYLGAIIGWRGAFFCLVPVAAIALAWLLFSLPALRASQAPAAGGIPRLLRRPAVVLGMAAVSLLFMGQFALFTYLRPFLEGVTGVSAATLSLMLLVLGVAGFVGTTLIGAVLKDRLYRVLVAMPLAMALVAGALVAFGHSAAAVTVLLALWGLVGTSAPVGWWTWLAQTLPDDAEAGGGLMVAVVQLAIMLGATLGGLLFDASGYRATFYLSAGLLVAAAVVALLAARSARHAHS